MDQYPTRSLKEGEKRQDGFVFNTDAFIHEVYAEKSYTSCTICFSKMAMNTSFCKFCEQDVETKFSILLLVSAYQYKNGEKEFSKLNVFHFQALKVLKIDEDEAQSLLAAKNFDEIERKMGLPNEIRNFTVKVNESKWGKQLHILDMDISSCSNMNAKDLFDDNDGILFEAGKRASRLFKQGATEMRKQVSSMDLLNDENDEVLFNTAKRVSSAFSRGIAPEDSEEEHFENLRQLFKSAAESFDESSKFQKTVQLMLDLRKFVGQSIVQTDDLSGHKVLTIDKAKEFQQMIKFAISIFEPFGPGYEPQILEILYGLGDCMVKVEQFNIAAECFESALTLCTKLNGTYLPDWVELLEKKLTSCGVALLKQ